jgi:hypothetical protein
MTDKQKKSTSAGGKLRLVVDEGPRLIDTTQALFEWLFDRLDELEPQIPVHDDLRAAVNALKADLCENGYINSPPTYFGEMFTGIYWADSPPDAETCGLGLLQLVGGLSESMVMSRVNIKVPISRVVEMLTFLADDYVGVIGWSPDERRLVSTPEFEAKYRVRVNVKREKLVEYDDIWNLEDVAMEDTLRKFPELKKRLKSRSRRSRAKEP